MKIPTTISRILLLSALSAQAAGRTPQTSPNQQAVEPRTPTSISGAESTRSSKIDPAKEAAIRQLIEVTGGTTAMNQVMDGMLENMKPQLVNAFPPGEYREKLIDLFFERFRSKADVRQLQDLSVQIYDKYLSEEDIKGLIQFYSTPIGQKALTVLPKLTIEMQSAGVKWGENLGRQSMIEVLSEHPELAKALEDAKKGSPPQ